MPPRDAVDSIAIVLYERSDELDAIGPYEVFENAAGATERDLAATGGDVRDARVVDDDDVLTAGGVTSGLDLAPWIVEAIRGTDVAEAVATEMEYERSGVVARSG